LLGNGVARRPATSLDWVSSVPAALLVATIGVAAFAQGGFYVRGQIAAGAALVAAVVAALPIRRATWRELRVPLLAGSLLAAWTLVRGAQAGSLAAAGRDVLLLVGLAMVLVVCHQIDRSGRQLVLKGLLGVGAILAVAGWVGIVWRVDPWALPAEGLWRAASTLTYANATAAVLVPIALTGAAMLSKRPRPLSLVVVVTVLLTGVEATMSRAGAFALLVGVLVLAVALGRSVISGLLAPAIGSAVAFLGLLPSLPTAAEPRPWLAVAALAGGIVVAAVLCLPVPRHAVLAGVVALVMVTGSVGVVVGSSSLHDAGSLVWDSRASLASPNRSKAAAAALRVVADHPASGVGPGQVVAQTTTSSGRVQVYQYVHNEYLQVLAELGTIGLALLAALLVSLARLLWRSRSHSAEPELWAGVAAACAAAAVQACFDFVWHVPAVPLTVAVLIGLAIVPVARDHRGPSRKGDIA
jgi:O-antigen ligase